MAATVYVVLIICVIILVELLHLTRKLESNVQCIRRKKKKKTIKIVP